jgi:hypothetical protein
MAALRHLPRLARVECAAPLGPDALRALRRAVGQRLAGLALDVVPRQHCPGDCLEELCGLRGLAELTVAYIAGRTLTHAAPLAALTGLRRLVRGARARAGRGRAAARGHAASRRPCVRRAHQGTLPN